MGNISTFMSQYGGTISQGIGTATQAYGEHQIGKDRQAISRANADLARINARDVIVRSGEDQTQLQRDKRRLIGAQVSAIGANNVTQSGSALDILADTEKQVARDQLTMRNNAARQAWALESEAKLESFAGATTRRNQSAKALGTLATGGMATYDSYEKAKART